MRDAATVQSYAVSRRAQRGGGAAAGPAAGHDDGAEEILEAIRRWTRLHGDPPTSMDWEPARARRMGHPWRAARFERGDWPSARMVRWRFGTFNDAVRRAGLVPRRAPARIRPNLTGPEAILDAIVEWTRRYGEVPSMADWDPVRARRLGQVWRIARYHDGDWPSARSVANHFGSFRAAVGAAGLVPRARSSSREERDTARRFNRMAVAAARGADRSADPGGLADAVRAVAASRSAGDPVALHAALLDVATVALAYAEVAAAEG
jgi:hypothetical protein